MYRRGSKHRNIPQTIDGYRFDSTREANRYAELRLLERAGEIKNLVADKKLLRFAMVVNGMLICQYEADFLYETKDGQRVVEDTKSPHLRKDAQYVIKKKLLFALHAIAVKEV